MPALPAAQFQELIIALANHEHGGFRRQVGAHEILNEAYELAVAKLFRRVPIHFSIVPASTRGRAFGDCVQSILDDPGEVLFRVVCYEFLPGGLTPHVCFLSILENPTQQFGCMLD